MVQNIVIASYLETLDSSPGVYRMINPSGKVIYVGKAKNLKKRVATYSTPKKLGKRLAKMIQETSSMEFVVTKTENEALIIEADLIKQYKPKYNILFRDDKTYAFIQLTSPHPYPAIKKIRQTQKDVKANDLFGPFVNNKVIDHTIKGILSTFKLRTCSDQEFAQRQKPCLQYHIKRCSAPCVNLIGQEDYNESVKQAREFLSLDNYDLTQELEAKMNKASLNWHYEKALMYRERLKHLQLLSKECAQPIKLDGLVHVIAVAKNFEHTCLQIFIFFNGYNRGNKVFYHSVDAIEKDVITAFIKSYYNNYNKNSSPDLILLSHELPEAETHFFKENLKLKLVYPQQGTKKQLINFVLDNAYKALNRKFQNFATPFRRLEEYFKLPVNKIEAYDNSHIFGNSAIGALISVGKNGFIKAGYRAYNIAVDKGDDYQMLKLTMTKRINSYLSEKTKATTSPLSSLPSIIVIDGGIGHLKTALSVLNKFNLAQDIFLLAVAKGENRKNETFITLDNYNHSLPKDIAYFIETIRDEVHNYAITSHRKKRDKRTIFSRLDEIKNIGPKRKKLLLKTFGSLENIKATKAKIIQEKTKIPLNVIQQMLTILKE